MHFYLYVQSKLPGNEAHLNKRGSDLACSMRNTLIITFYFKITYPSKLLIALQESTFLLVSLNYKLTVLVPFVSLLLSLPICQEI